MKSLYTASLVAVLALSACSGGVKGPDLGQVLDRTVYAMEYYHQQTTTDTEEVVEMTDANLEEFRGIMTQVMNAQPAFHEKNLGVALEQDASFTGFNDKNSDNIKDSGEKEIFRVEIDAERSRLIATDLVSGEATTFRASGTGFLAGALVGRLMGRQSAAGVKSSSFANRKTTARSSYDSKRSSARSRTRTGSSRSGK